MTETAFNIALPSSIIAWVFVYVLMIRRGIKDKSYSMPVVALCFNISWELYFTFFVDSPLTNRIGNGTFVLFDLGVLYTCWRYGRNDFDWPIFQEHFHKFLVLILFVSFTMLSIFVSSFDDYGILITLFAQLIYSTLFIAMILRRNSVKGQSLYIGLGILIGDACGLIVGPYVQHTSQPTVPMAWLNACNIYILLAHIFYLGLYYHVARRDGINPWRRL